MIFKPVLVEKILSGEKTVTRRPVTSRECFYKVGKEYALQPGMGRVTVGRIVVLGVDELYLSQIDNEDAVNEGFNDAAEFKEYWADLYDGKFDKQMKVWRIHFELVEGTHRICSCCNGVGAVEL